MTAEGVSCARAARPSARRALAPLAPRRGGPRARARARADTRAAPPLSLARPRYPSLSFRPPFARVRFVVRRYVQYIGADTCSNSVSEHAQCRRHLRRAAAASAAAAVADPGRARARVLPRPRPRPPPPSLLALAERHDVLPPHAAHRVHVQQPRVEIPTREMVDEARARASAAGRGRGGIKPRGARRGNAEPPFAPPPPRPPPSLNRRAAAGTSFDLTRSTAARPSAHAATLAVRARAPPRRRGRAAAARAAALAPSPRARARREGPPGARARAGTGVPRPRAVQPTASGTGTRPTARRARCGACARSRTRARAATGVAASAGTTEHTALFWVGLGPPARRRAPPRLAVLARAASTSCATTRRETRRARARRRRRARARRREKRGSARARGRPPRASLPLLARPPRAPARAPRAPARAAPLSLSLSLGCSSTRTVAGRRLWVPEQEHQRWGPLDDGDGRAPRAGTGAVRRARLPRVMLRGRRARARDFGPTGGARRGVRGAGATYGARHEEQGPVAQILRAPRLAPTAARAGVPPPARARGRPPCSRV